MANKELNFDNIWKKPVIKIGRTTLLLAALFSFLPSLYLYLAHGVFPTMSVALKSWGMIAAIYGVNYFVEPLSFYSVLGLSGTYMSFLAGNISNLRLPCAAIALEATETEPGSKEAEIISTLGIAGSIVTNLVGVTIAAFLGTAIISAFPPVVADAFKSYTVPAIFGAIFGQAAIKNPKLGVVGLGIPVLLRLTISAPSWVYTMSAIFGTMFAYKIMYTMKSKKTEE